MHHMMIDLETMGTAANAVIAQIGYTIFKQDGAICFQNQINVDIQSCVRCGLQFDGDTIKWWMHQSDDARKSLFEPAPVSLGTALGTLEAAYKQYTPIRVWAYPASFDLAILEYAYRAIGFKTPWHYREIRDARTLIAQALTQDELTKTGVEHTCLADCHNQIHWLLEAGRRLNITFK